MRILELYYKIWGEWLNFWKQHPDATFSHYYKFWSFFYMSVLNGLWVLTIDTLLWYFDLSISDALSLSKDKIVGGLQLMLITAGPFGVLNYFLTFYKGKYKWLMEKYQYNKEDKKLLFIFSFGSVMVFLLAVYSHFIVEFFTGNAYLGM